jgi:BA14K-like protein
MSPKKEASMRKLVHGFALAGIAAASFVALPVSQGMALTIPPVGVSAPNGNMVIDVANRGGSRYWKYRHNNNWNRHGNWNHHNNWHHGGHNYRGHGNDWWWPGVAGVGIGLGLGLLNNAPYYSQPVYRVAPGASSAHVAWCERRYRSYRVYDNTYQPYHGPRRECISPYM